MKKQAKTTDELNWNARAAHVAIANQVAHQGTELARLLYAAARAYNEKYFRGALLPCFVELTTPGSLRALADYRPKTPEGVESHIRIGRAAGGSLLMALDALLHEMVHAYMHEIAEDLEVGYKGHGPKFTAECNRLGEMMGLPPVFTKGRGGPNSASWPLCVRPAGYYGTEQEPAKKPAKKPARKASVPNERDSAAETTGEQLARILAAMSRTELEALHGIIGDMIAAQTLVAA
jgi:hypothetical protein